MTGTARISGRRPFETAVWEFDATHKIVLSTNKPPTVRGTDKGIWRRLVMIPFGVTFWDPDDDEHGPPRLEVDKSLPAKLRTEYPGILAWAVRGCLAWQSSGLRIPESAKEATRAYRESEDTVSSFIAECCREGEDERTLTSAIYRHYCEFADQARLSKNKILGRNTFLAEIKKRYGNPRKVGDHRYFHGVRSRGRY